MTDKQIRDKIVGALSVSMMPMAMEKECIDWVDKRLSSGWISVEERLPKERETIFSKMIGTSKELPGMFAKMSERVIATYLCKDGTKIVKEAHTKDGKWDLSRVYGAVRVTHWMPLPEPPGKDGGTDGKTST